MCIICFLIKKLIKAWFGENSLILVYQNITRELVLPVELLFLLTVINALFIGYFWDCAVGIRKISWDSVVNYAEQLQ